MTLSYKLWEPGKLRQACLPSVEASLDEFALCSSLPFAYIA